jgi:hypothetical protein
MLCPQTADTEPKPSTPARTFSAELIGSTEDMIEIDFVDGKISRVGDQ